MAKIRSVAVFSYIMLLIGWLVLPVGMTEEIVSAQENRVWLKSLETVRTEVAEPAVYVMIVNDADLETLEDVFRVIIAANVPIEKYHLYFINNPLRLVIDLAGKWKNSGDSVVVVENDVIRQIRLGEHPDKLRIVMDLKVKEPPSPIIENLPKGLSVTLKRKRGTPG